MAQSIYKPLDPHSNQIRLLRLEPTISESVTPLHGSLDVVSLDENPEYIAISYEWKPPKLQNQSAARAVINGRELPVTPNMAKALLCTQDGVPTSTDISGPTRFWIDALCINQEDDDERGHQVSIMGQIYQQASAVRAWLGDSEAEDNSDLAMDLLLEFSDYLEVSDAIRNAAPTLLEKWNEQVPTSLNEDQAAAWIQTEARNWIRNLSTRIVNERAAQWVNERLDHPAYSDRWVALASLCSRSYWSRSWIIQELAMSSINNPSWWPSTRIYCGARNVDLYSLFVLCTHVRGLPFFEVVYSETILDLAHAIQRVLWVARAWSLFRRGKADLLDLLGKSSEFETSESRDKIYSLLGLAKPYIGSQLNADYTISASEVLRKTAIHIILGSQNLKILLFCAKNGNRMPGLPSWVPDWTNFKSHSLPGIYPTLGKPWPVERPPYQQVDILENSTVLQVKARPLGHIHSIANGEDIPLNRGNEIQSETRVVALLNTWIDLALTDLHHAPPDDKNLSTVVSVFHFLYCTMLRTLGYNGKSMKKWPFEAFVSWILSTRSQEPESSSSHLGWEQLAHLTTYLCSDRCFFKYHEFSNLPNSEGLQALGICSRGVNPGDALLVVQGCPYPLVVRSVGSRGNYELISDAIVDGFINGEASGIAPELEITLS